MTTDTDTLREAKAILRKALPDLNAAAIPTKSEVFVLCGRPARDLHDAIEAALATLSKPEPAEVGEDQDFRTVPATLTEDQIRDFSWQIDRRYDREVFPLWLAKEVYEQALFLFGKPLYASPVPSGGAEGSANLRELVAKAKAAYDAMTPEQKKAHDDAQRESFIRGMTTPCEHGVLDFEQCGDCMSKAPTPSSSSEAISPPDARELIRDLRCIDRGGVLHANPPKDVHPICRKAADFLANLPGPPDARAVVEALAKCVGIQSNGGNGDHPFVKVYFDKPGDEAAFHHLIAALQSGASDTGEATERRRIVAWLRSHESTGYVEPFDEAANAIESCAHLTQSGASK